MGLLTPTPHALSAFLLEKGFIIRPVVPPTVPPGGERIRICLRAGMQKEVLRRLVGALDEWVTRCMKEETRIRSSHSVGGMSEVAVKARL